MQRKSPLALVGGGGAAGRTGVRASLAKLLGGPLNDVPAVNTLIARGISPLLVVASDRRKVALLRAPTRSAEAVTTIEGSRNLGLSVSHSRTRILLCEGTARIKFESLDRAKSEI